MSDIHVTCWALSKAHAEAMLTALGIIEVEGNYWRALVQADIAEVTVPYLTGNVVIDEFGHQIQEQLTRDGFHFDIIYRGATALNLLRPLPVDEDGNPVPWDESADLFDKTLLLEMAEARSGLPLAWVQTNQPVPPGFEANGVRMFDPDLIASRSHGWA